MTQLYQLHFPSLCVTTNSSPSVYMQVQLAFIKITLIHILEVSIIDL